MAPYLYVKTCLATLSFFSSLLLECQPSFQQSSKLTFGNFNIMDILFELMIVPGHLTLLSFYGFLTHLKQK